jgi:hypothetical protein
MLKGFIFKVKLNNMIPVSFLNDLEEYFNCALWNGFGWIRLAKFYFIAKKKCGFRNVYENVKLLVDIRKFIQEENLVNIDL